MTPDVSLRFEAGGPLDLAKSMRGKAMGLFDPCARLTPHGFVRATRTAGGPASYRIAIDGAHVVFDAFGPGADAIASKAHALAGMHDAPDGFVTEHPLMSKLAKRHRGLRLCRAPSLFEALVTIVLEQRVTFEGAARSYGRLVRAYSEPAPGPFDLLLPVAAERLAALPYYALAPLRIEKKRADTLRRLAALETRGRIRALEDGPLEVAKARLLAVRGVGPWTVGNACGHALADPDAVPVGDLHLPSLITQFLANERKGTDERMLELLVPFAGHRFRAIRLVALGL
jgi:3-methyladenine DNA glycosylase/8-oxoguanine DNA glycosylase